MLILVGLNLSEELTHVLLVPRKVTLQLFQFGFQFYNLSLLNLLLYEVKLFLFDLQLLLEVSDLPFEIDH